MSLADDAQAYHEALLADDIALAHLHKLRGWTRDAIERLQVGERIDGRKRVVTFPIRNKGGQVVNILSYRPDPRTRGDAPKMLGLPNKRRDLFPGPETLDKKLPVILGEGEPDVVAGWSMGLQFVGLPGVGKWDARWPTRFAGLDLSILLDADEAGEEKAQKIARPLAVEARSVRVVYLPDGDLTDYLLAGGTAEGLLKLPSERVQPLAFEPISASSFAKTAGKRNPEHDLLGPLIRKGQRIVIAGKTGQGKTTLTLQIIKAAAYGEEFLGWRGRKNGCKCLIVALEGDKASVGQRIAESGLIERNGNVQIVHIPEGLDLAQFEQLRAVEKLLAQGWDIVALDPYYRLDEGEVKEEQVTRRLTKRLDLWRARYGCALIVPAHMRKGFGGAKLGMNLDDIYGSSVIGWNAEIVLGIQFYRDKTRLYWFKDRDGDCRVPINDFWRLSFDADTGAFTRLADTDDAPTIERVRAALASGEMTVAQLMAATGASERAIRAALADLEALGEVTYRTVEHGLKLWRLVAQERLTA